MSKGHKIYSQKLTVEQNAALARYEGLTSCAPYGIKEFDKGEITAKQLWDQNIAWIVGAAIDAQNIDFPEGD